MTRLPDNEYEISQTIRFPRPADQEAILVSTGDWDSIVIRIRSCRTAFNTWAVAYSVTFAIAVTAGLSIIPIASSGLPMWISVIYIVLCSVGLVSGIILVIAERGLARRQQSQIDDLINDMDRIKSHFILSSANENEEVTFS